MTTPAAIRAWDPGHAAAPVPWLSLILNLENTITAYEIEEQPSIEVWDSTLQAVGGDLDTRREAAIGVAHLWRVDASAGSEFVYDLDCVDGDIGAMAADLEAAGLGHSTILFVDLVVVDGFWRGGGLGPAMVWQAAHRLQCDFVALQPHPQFTAVEAGVCYADYEGPRPGSGARRKLRAGWRRAGFEPVHGKTWGAEPYTHPRQRRESLLALQRAERALRQRHVDQWVTQRDQDRRVAG